MQTIEEFMRWYFFESANYELTEEEKSNAFVSRYYTVEMNNARSRNSINDGQIEQMKQPIVLELNVAGNKAQVIIFEMDCGELKRHIYRLKVEGENWKIDRIGSECSICKGKVRGWGNCPICDGSGWCYY